MDSLAPNLVIIVTYKQGDVDVTLDCKIKASLCLLSPMSARTFDVNKLFGNNKDTVRRVLAQYDTDIEYKK